MPRFPVLAAPAFFALMTLAGLLLPDFELLTLNQHLFLAVNVLALNFCLGLGGQASLAQGAFCGLGAYASTILHLHFPGSSLLIVPAVTAATCGLAALISYPLEKLGEGFLAMATLGVSLIFINLVLSLESLTNGPAGMMVDSALTLPGGLALAGDKTYFFLFLATLAVGMYSFDRLRNSRTGRALLACREDAVAASACGINRTAVRAIAFGLGGGLSALAGALYAHYSGFISPRQFDLELSLKTLLFLVIGGPGHLIRPIIAVLVLEALLSRMQFLGEAKVLFHGLLLAAALLIGIAYKNSSLRRSKS